MIKNNLINGIFLLLMPVAYIASYGLVGSQKGPYYWTPNQEPDYAYLLDSLNLINSNSLAVIQHPGTPVQLLGAIVLALTYVIRSIFGSPISSINDDVLTNPELYLNSVNYTFLGINSVCLLLIGFTCFWLSKNLFLSLILQTTPLIMAMSVLGGGSRVSIEPILFGISQILAILLVVYLYKPGVERSPQFAASLGIIFGVGMATKLAFLPMVLLFGLLPRSRHKAIAALSTTAAFLLTTLPIIIQPEGFTNLLVRTGLYSGSETSSSRSTVFETLSALVSNNIILIALTALLTIGCLLIPLLAKYGNYGLNLNDLHLQRLLILACWVSIALWLQIILSIRVQEQAQIQSLMPAIGLAGFAAFLIVQLYLTGLLAVVGDALDVASLTEFIMAIALAFCVALGIYQIYSSSLLIRTRHDVRYADMQAIQTLLVSDNQYKTCAIALSRRASTVESALKFAQFWTGEAFSETLSRLYPQAIFYNEDSKTYESYRQSFGAIAPLKQGQTCILFRTNPFRGRRAQFRSNPELEQVFKGRTEELYRIKLSS